MVEYSMLCRAKRGQWDKAERQSKNGFQKWKSVQEVSKQRFHVLIKIA